VRRLLLRVAVVLLGEVVVCTAAGGRMAGMAGADAVGVVGGLRLLLLELLVLVLMMERLVRQHVRQADQERQCTCASTCSRCKAHLFAGVAVPVWSR
jgi:hypothetical protein